MGHMSAAQKEEIQARISAINFSGFDMKLGYNLCRHYRSFVGRDFKALAQIALFLLGVYMSPAEKTVWLSLSKVGQKFYYVFYNFTSLSVHRFSGSHTVNLLGGVALVNASVYPELQ